MQQADLLKKKPGSSAGVDGEKGGVRGDVGRKLCHLNLGFPDKGDWTVPESVSDGLIVVAFCCRTEGSSSGLGEGVVALASCLSPQMPPVLTCSSNLHSVAYTQRVGCTGIVRCVALMSQC